MASKRELEKRVKLLEDRLTQLENMHATIERATVSWFDLDSHLSSALNTYAGFQGEYCGRRLTYEELRDRQKHPKTEERTANTSHICGVTHEELARYVLDGKPIERKMQTKVEYTTICAPGAKTKSVKTDLGNISVTEGND